MTSDDVFEAGESVEREVLAAHRRLDALFVEVQAAFQRRRVSDAARESFKELSEALDTHFDQEDRLYYPAIWALRPDLKPQLHAFSEEHAGFRRELESIEALLATEDFEEACRAIEALAGRFGRHELSEEATLGSLDRELSRSG